MGQTSVLDNSSRRQNAVDRASRKRRTSQLYRRQLCSWYVTVHSHDIPVHRSYLSIRPSCASTDGGCLDNDDGSSYYDIHDNVCFFGGHKQNFDGHSKRGFRNLYIHPQVYGTKCIDEETEGESTHTSGPHGLPFKGYAEAYFDNVCILPNANDPYYVGGGDLSDVKDFNDGMKLSNNTIYAPDGNVSLSVSGDVVSFETFQSLGFDPTSVVSSDVPSTSQVKQWARSKLGF